MNLCQMAGSQPPSRNWAYHVVLKCESRRAFEVLLALDGSDFEMAPGVVVEFSARRAAAAPERPHGIGDAFVLRPEDGARKRWAGTLLSS